MQAGFAMVETGFCRSKNAVHVIMTNFVIFAIGVIAYWAVGFALEFGGVGYARHPRRRRSRLTA